MSAVHWRGETLEVKSWPDGSESLEVRWTAIETSDHPRVVRCTYRREPGKGWGGPLPGGMGPQVYHWPAENGYRDECG